MIREDINTALKQAIKAKEKRQTSTLRLINAAIKDRDIAARTTSKELVSDQDILEILAKMIKQRKESVMIYEEAGRLELAQQEQEEIDIISQFMPQQLSDQEIEKAVKEIIQEIDAQGLRDMGRIMAALKERYSGQMDFSKASQIVKAQFS